MEILFELVTVFWSLSVSIGYYVFLGLVFVGIVHLYISEEWIKKHLGQGSQYDAFKGALYGIPLPLCSCGVIPLAASLRKKGASKKAVTSFFITTPMTGVDSIIATYGVFGLPMAIIRVVSSLISGILAGLLVKNDDIAPQEPESCCSNSCGCPSESEKEPSSLQKAYDYAIYEVFADIAKPMLYGLILATLFMVFIPQSFLYHFNESLLLTYIVVFLLSLPIYVCSISAIPIAISLLAFGLSPGAAFIFLAAAPATNIITAGIIKKIMGMKTMIIYLVSIILTTTLFALLIDYLLPTSWFTFIDKTLHEDVSITFQITGVLFVAMTLYFSIKGIMLKGNS
jgi:hypothetical protein